MERPIQSSEHISWEVDVWGRVRSQRAAVQENYEAVALDYAFARQLLNTQLANRINLHLALGGSFDSSPATSTPAATAVHRPPSN